jgi:hypothetical protein
LVFLTKTEILKNGYKSHHDFHARLMNRPCVSTGQNYAV